MYQSPFRFFDAGALPEEGVALRRALALEKKKLLAGFELAGAPTVMLDGVALHRQDVVRLFDELSDEPRLRYHLAISQDKALLLFLEQAQLQQGVHLASNPLYDDAGFIRFVSPYYAEATNALLRALLTGKTPIAGLDTFSKLRQLREDADTEAAYRYTTRFFLEKKNELLSIRQKIEAGKDVAIAEISGWCSDAGIQVLNRLPDTFTALRYILANTLNNICVAYDRQKNLRHSLAAIEAAAKIRTDDEELKQLIPSNLTIIRRKASRGWWQIDPATGRKKPKLALIIAIIIIVIRIATGLDNCNHATVKPFGNYSNRPVAVPDKAPAAQSFTALLRSLAMHDSLPRSDTFFMYGEATGLLRPRHAGDDVFRPLFGSDTLREPSSMGITPGDTSAMLLRNESNEDVVALYCVGGRMYGSAYVPPRSSYTICYYLPGIAVGIYAGHDWDDSLAHSYERHLSPYYSHRQLYRGGFRVAAAVPNADTSGAALIERGVRTAGAVRDTITVGNTEEPNSIGFGLNLDET